VPEICEHGNEHLGFLKCGDLLTGLVTISFFKSTLLHGSGYEENEKRIQPFSLQSEGKKLIPRPRHRCENKYKMFVK
jgi:hypothetical protein